MIFPFTPDNIQTDNTFILIRIQKETNAKELSVKWALHKHKRRHMYIDVLEQA